MKALFRLLSLLPLFAGLALLSLGLWRHRLPYVNERYFDPVAEVVYLQQAAEGYTVLGALLTFLGLLIAVGSWIALRPIRAAFSGESSGPRASHDA